MKKPDSWRKGNRSEYTAMKRFRIDANNLCIAVVAIAPILFFWKALFLKYDLFYDDIYYVFYNMRSLLYFMGRAGRLFLWNPFEFSGMDCTGDIQKGIFYPFNIIYYFISTGPAISYYVTFHFMLQSIFTYLYLRSRALSPVSSCCGALIFTFGSFTVLHICSLNFLGTICWLPILLLILERCREKLRLDLIFCGAIVVALMFLSGAPQMFYYCGLFFILYGILVISGFIWHREYRKAAMTLIAYIVIGAVAAGLSAVQMIPFQQMSQGTFREGGTSFDFSNSFCLSLRMLKTLLVPFFYGGTHTESYQGDWNFFDGVFYFGIFTFFLALPGLIVMKDRLKGFYLSVLVISFGTSLGGSFIFFPLMFKYLPFFDLFRTPSRFMCFVNFILAVGAAYGVEWLMKVKDRQGLQRGRMAVNIISILIIAILLLIAYTGGSPSDAQWREMYVAVVIILASNLLLRTLLAGRLSMRFFALLAVVLLLADLWFFGLRYVQFVPHSEVVKIPAPYAALPADDSTFRVVTNTDIKTDENYMRWNLRFGCESVQGFNALAQRDYVTYLFFNETHQIPSGEFIERLRIHSYAFYLGSSRTAMTDLLNVKYYFDYDEKSGSARVDENRTFLPRFFLVKEFMIEPERDRILEYLSNPSFNAGQVVFLEKKPETKDIETVKMLNVKSAGGADSVSVTSHRFDEIVLETRSSLPSILFASEVFHPDWKAFIDGREVTVYRANYVFRSLFVPSGTHRITMRYEPSGFKTGLILTFVTLLSVIACFCVMGALRFFRKPRGSLQTH
ncbi:MAG: YfhO family protein [Vulcanimicrobiota bacterium]